MRQTLLLDNYETDLKDMLNNNNEIIETADIISPLEVADSVV